MKIIIFVRHGQSEANVAHVLSDDINANPLTKVGISQAEKTALELKHIRKVDAFYTSPVLRAVQTAGIISKQINEQPMQDHRLRERGFGSFNNRKFASPEEMERTVIGEALRHYGGGMETWDVLKQRVSDFIDNVPENPITIAVSHRDTIAAALAVIDAQYDDDTIKAEALNIPQASITTIDAKRRKILSIGSGRLPIEL